MCVLIIQNNYWHYFTVQFENNLLRLNPSESKFNWRLTNC